MKSLNIGRDKSNNIVISDSKVSRFHLQIVQTDKGSFILEDLNSANGTFINGKRVHGQTQLQRTDIIRIGNTTPQWLSYFNNAGEAVYSVEDKAIKNEFYINQNQNQSMSPKNEVLGILSLIFGILSFFIAPFALAGLVLGFIAIVSSKGKGYGIAGLILSIIVIIVYIILIVVFGSFILSIFLLF